jgi:cytochrome c oxidase subunit 1/cytochrome c oxidase subunit I+III
MSESTLPADQAMVPEAARSSWLLDLITTVDHKKIGVMYMAGALLFLLLGGVEALLIRAQLALPQNTLLSPSVYNQMMTMHGTTMVFFFGMPLLVGAMNYLVPLQIGARDVAFPRLNAFTFWLFLFSGLLLYASFFVEAGAPAAGWFSYAPLSEQPYMLNNGQDYWALSLLTSGIGSIAASINIIVTVLTLRAPGLTLRRLPLFSWMALVVSFLTVFTIAVLNAALVGQLVDRLLGGHFFRPASGGSAVLWQHIFWAFGHPEVYILIIPAFGFISEVIPVFSRRPIFGYGFVAASTVLITLLSFSVWAHHMFAVGLGPLWDALFGLTSLLIAVPTGVKVLNWTATLARGAIRFSVAMCFALAFLIHFTMGGITGVMFASYPVDWLLTDSYFVVAHFHYVLIGGTVFAFFAAAYYWFPKVSGRMLSERIGYWHFGLAVVGFNLAFFVQHLLGLAGMPRRVYTYPALPGWGVMNLLSTIGAFLFGLAVLVFVFNLIYSAFRGRVAGDNPWNAWTLEWATSSPPPQYNFERVPLIRSRRPLWDLAHPEDPDWNKPEAGGER